MPSPNEIMPLLTPQQSPGFFQKSVSTIKNNSCETVAIVAASAVSVVTYYVPSYQAGASVADGLKEITAASGLGTNFFFNIQAYRELSQQFAKLLKLPLQLSAAVFFSIMCVAPTIFMNIVDEEGNYIDAPLMTLQIFSALLNVGVNVVGSMGLINGIVALFKNQTDLKEKLIEEMNLVIQQFSQKRRLALNELLSEEFEEELSYKLIAINDLSLPRKISYYFFNVSIGLFSIPQFTAYLLISYFGMRDLSEKKFGATHSISILLGLIAAIGNGIPGAGFSIKGINATSKKLMSLEKPSLLAIFFALPALFSGFTTHKAMADSLKKLGYSGNIAEALKWIANLGAALIYNLPQMLALADSLNPPAISDQLTNLKKYIENEIKNSDIRVFKRNLPIKLSVFFRDHPAENNDSDDSLPSYNSINSTRV